MVISQKILDEAYVIIQRLAKSRSTNGAFAHYESDDIYQEIWVMCLEALDRYDSSIGPLENYLVTHISNRLKNLKRDNYFRPGFDVQTSGLARTRMNLVNAWQLDMVDATGQGILLGSASINIDPVEHFCHGEALEYIKNYMPNHLIEAFGELIGNNKVHSSIIKQIHEKVIGILNEEENDVGCQESKAVL